MCMCMRVHVCVSGYIWDNVPVKGGDGGKSRNETGRCTVILSSLHFAHRHTHTHTHTHTNYDGTVTHWVTHLHLLLVHHELYYLFTLVTLFLALSPFSSFTAFNWNAILQLRLAVHKSIWFCFITFTQYFTSLYLLLKFFVLKFLLLLHTFISVMFFTNLMHNTCGVLTVWA